MSLLNKLFPKARAEILRLLFADLDREIHLRDLARHAGLTAPALQKELAQLTATDLVLSRRDGNRLYFKANTNHPLYPELHGIVTKTTGIAERLRTALDSIPGIDLAFVFGSIAAGTSTADSDIDLFIIGTTGLRKLTPHLRPLSSELSREINPYCLSPEDWLTQKKRSDAFITRVINEPKLWLKGTPHELARLG
ncbi:toxin-antitoxin system toxin subunit [Phragmitibacter flavus]|uniref:Toxin-antitoxin system toxin subunit n=1 Tax=Phragmitibacter flavus TaxID=2576071 RepID=A0A5R8K8R9_9BACT|nr:nucleotidyltransferase domain-containing protein [Phragmitibacter flavus]TLD68713.1 toxin-antitoxin system toxin subunit [Phragmitibacter flavus]